MALLIKAALLILLIAYFFLIGFRLIKTIGEFTGEFRYIPPESAEKEIFSERVTARESKGKFYTRKTAGK